MVCVGADEPCLLVDRFQFERDEASSNHVHALKATSEDYQDNQKYYCRMFHVRKPFVV
jgi:hypothetical protein